MTTIQRMKSDISTRDRREMTDNDMRESRLRNDKSTEERRSNTDRFETADNSLKESRSRNDETTMARRDTADNLLVGNRVRNDELTANRREIKDVGMGMTFAVFLVLLAIFAVGLFFIFG